VTRARPLLSPRPLLLAILVAAGLLRFGDLGGWSLWNDELYTLLVLPVSSLLAKGIPVDQHPPLYYLILEKWLTLGAHEFFVGEFFARLPSAVAGWLAVYLMWRTGMAIAGSQLGLLTAVLLALSPLHIWYSREVRMYGLATFFWLAAIYFFVMLFNRKSWLDILGLAAATIASVYTAYPSLALWVMQLVLFVPLWQWRGRPGCLAARWLVTQLIIVAGLVVWWPFLQVQLSRSAPFIWLGMSLTLADTFRLAIIAAGFFVIATNALWLLVIRRPIRLPQWRQWLSPAAGLVVLLLIISTVLAATGRGLSLRRQLLVFWPPFVLLAGWALLRLNRRRLNIAVIGLTLILGLGTTFGPPYEDWRGAADLVESLAEPGDQVWAATGGVKAALDYYLAGGTASGATVPVDLEHQPPESGSRIWLVTNDHPTTSIVSNPIKSWVAGNSLERSSYRFSRYITVRELWVP
jgi:mannosyltransferase